MPSHHHYRNRPQPERNYTRRICIALAASVFLLLTLLPVMAATAETHPFILYSSGDIGVIRERLAGEPFDGWFARLTGIADGILSDGIEWDSDTVPPETKAYYAKTLACAWALSDSSSSGRPAWGHEAALALRNMPTGPYSSHFSSDLTMSEAVLFWAEAYDMLKGGGFDFVIEDYGDVEPSIRSAFVSMRDFMARDTFGLTFPALWLEFTSAAWAGASASDNHHVKLNAALAVLSLVIADEEGSSDDLEHAVSRLRESLGNLTVDNYGGWAEGPNYHLYSAHQYLSAVRALKAVGGADLYADISGLAASHLLLPHMVMPDGFMPPVDDNEAVVFGLAGLLYSYHRGLDGRDMLHWMWERAGKPVPAAFLVDYITGYDADSPVFPGPAAMGEPLSAFFPESGFARFRSSWDNDAVYMLLQSENGTAHTAGRAHEHPDQNSFILHAYGEMLILDSGYGGWDSRHLTRFAENHNLILVNGEGPSAAEQSFGSGLWSIAGNGASITGSFTSPMLDYAESETLYANAFFTRRVVFVDRRYFLIFDTIEAGDESDYTLLLHGNGGGESGGTFTPNTRGGVWSRASAGVSAYVAGSSPDLSFDVGDMHHAVYARKPMLTHTVLKASQWGKAASFLTVLTPFRATETAPSVIDAVVEGGRGALMAVGSDTVYSALRSGDNDIVVSIDGSPLATDGLFLWCSADSDGGITRLFLVDAAHAEDSGGTIVETSSPVTMSIDRSITGIIEGVIRTPAPVEVSFHGISGGQVYFDGRPLPDGTLGAALVFTAEQSGAYRIEYSHAVVLEPPSTLTARDVPGDNGHSIRLEWTLSPSEESGLVDFYRIYRSRSPEFSDPKPASSFASIDDLAVWEEHAVVLVDSVAAGVGSFVDPFVLWNEVNYYYWVEAAGNGAASEKVSLDLPLNVNAAPAEFMLLKPYPNPFNAETSIEFTLTGGADVELAVYDVRGAQVAVLTRGFMPAGSHVVRWDGANTHGVHVSSGLYFVVLSSGSVRAVEKTMLMK